VQIGVRLMLPLVALAIVGLAAATVRACQSLPDGEMRYVLRRRFAVIGIGVCVLCTSAASVAVWPHGLSYINPLWGGAKNGYRLLSDSNYDWGQGLKELVAWQQHHGDLPLDVWYFGTDPAVKNPPLHEVPFHNLRVATGDDVKEKVRGHLLAVSSTILYGAATDTTSHQRAAEYLRSCRPIARTTTFFIYDFREGEKSMAHVGAGP